jgi:peptidoglycan/xylan/chitin deacetylase (PgdA/CDA1 family)
MTLDEAIQHHAGQSISLSFFFDVEAGMAQRIAHDVIGSTQETAYAMRVQASRSEDVVAMVFDDGVGGSDLLDEVRQ